MSPIKKLTIRKRQPNQHCWLMVCNCTRNNKI